MSSNLLRAATLVFASFAAPAFAVVVGDLHEVVVPVPDQSQDQRAKAFRAALAVVVIRLTGDAKAPAAPDLAALMKAPQRFVGEFAYVDDAPNAADGALPLPIAGQSGARSMLRVRFEGLLLERALRQAGRTVWGPERPLTLVWLALDDGPERDLVGAEDAEEFVAAAEERGLPLTWPSLDADDRAVIDLTAVTTLDEERITAASARHPSDAVLAGRVWRVGKGWQGRFTWHLGDDHMMIEQDASTLEALAGAIFDQLAADGITRYGVANAEVPNVVEIAFEGVADLDAYARAFAYLQGLSLVRHVDLIGSKGDVLRVRVTFRGEITTLERILLLDPMLQRSSEAPSGGGLRYRLAAPSPTKPPASAQT